MKFKLIFIYFLVSVSLFAVNAVHLEKRIGAHVGIIDTPLLSLFSANMAFNLTENLRATGGMGTAAFFQKGYTLGGELLWLIFSENFTPVLGINVSYANITELMIFTSKEVVNPFWNSSVVFGVDWQTDFGIAFGLGAHWIYWTNRKDKDGHRKELKNTVFPYLRAGVFF